MTIRVLHLISSLDDRDGGPVTALVGLASCQQGIGMAVTVLHTDPHSDMSQASIQLREAGVQISLTRSRPRGPIRWTADLRVLLREAIAHCDVVHLHGAWECIHLYGLREAARSRRPAVLRPCGMLDPWSLRQGSRLKMIWWRGLLRPLLQQVTGLHAVTEREGRLLREMGLRPPVHVVPNGVEFEQGCTPRLPADRKGRINLLFLGRLHPKKGLHLLIPAIAELRRGGFDVHLTIAGDGRDPVYTSRLRDMVRQLCLDTIVTFQGHVDAEERDGLLADSDLLILPSYQENFANVVIEAAAMGVPSIVSEQVYLVDELVAAGAGGMIPFDRSAPDSVLIASIVDTLGEWLSIPDRRRDASANAIAFARRFDWLAIVRRWEDLYRQMMR